MKDSELPTLKGKVVKLDPATKPKEIQLAMMDGSGSMEADAVLKFEMPLPGMVEEGTELSFEGVATSFTASPFMVNFEVEPEKLHGWTGVNPKPAPAKRRAPAKKG
jgi:hypothetical protein